MEEKKILGAIILIVIAVVALQYMNKPVAAPAPIIIPPGGGGQQLGGCPSVIPEKVTATFESKDKYLPSTDAGTAHLIIGLGDGGLLENVVIADGGTRDTSTCDKFEVLIGNETGDRNNATGTIGLDTTYYPTLFSGSIPGNVKTYTISKDQVNAAEIADLTITYFNEFDQANTGQSLGVDSEKTVKVKIAMSADECFGNPDTGKNNVICFTYDNTFINDVELIDHKTATVPQSAPKCTNNNTECFQFPVICDNADTGEMKLRIKATGTEPTAATQLNMSLYDVSYYINADDLKVYSGIEDEDNYDTGTRNWGREGATPSCAGNLVGGIAIT